MLLTLLLFTLCTFAEQGKQEVVSLPESISKKTKCLNKDYLLFIPKGNSKSNKSPLIIFLHGMGERGTNLKMVKKHGPPKIVEKNKNFEFIVISPQCLKDVKGKGWWHTQDLNMLLDHVKKTYNVDEKRIYLTGLSMGGFGSWAWSASNPKEFAAVAPVCGGGKPSSAKMLKKVPIWAFHGDKDTVVQLSKSQEMVDAVKKAGGDAKLTIYPGVGHNSWTKAYGDPELYKWFLSHKK